MLCFALRIRLGSWKKKKTFLVVVNAIFFSRARVHFVLKPQRSCKTTYNIVALGDASVISSAGPFNCLLVPPASKFIKSGSAVLLQVPFFRSAHRNGRTNGHTNRGVSINATQSRGLVRFCILREKLVSLISKKKEKNL